MADATLKQVREFLGTEGKPVSLSEIKELDDAEREELRRLVGEQL